MLIKNTIKEFKRPTPDLEIFATPANDKVLYPENTDFLQIKHKVDKPTK